MSKAKTIDIEVRWGDLDAFNHVNNTVFLRFVEESRIQFFDELVEDWDNIDEGPVVVNINCNFRGEIRYPATVRIKVEARVASEKRLVMVHTLTDRDNPERLYADAEVTAVWVSKSAGQSVPIPDAVRDALSS